MFPRSNQAACRLTARRRLALGGLALTGALAAGAFVSTPAIADTPAPVRVGDLSSLQDAVAGGDASIQLGADINADNSTVAALVLHGATTLDLDGHSLGLSQISVAANTAFTLTDSTAGSPDATGNALLSISGAPTPQADPNTPITGVLLGAGSTFTDSAATLHTTGYDGGAGIGSEGAAGAAFVADASAQVVSYGTDDGQHGGAAGIGGESDQAGIAVTIAGGADVSAYGGNGAAGVGGGYGGDGGQVHIVDGSLQATQGVLDANAASPASSVGGGEAASGTPAFGGLTLDAHGALELAERSPLRIPGGITVENGGTISLADEDATGAKQVFGSGTIHNLGTIDAEVDDPDGFGTPVDPSSLMASSITVTGYNFTLAVDANGGTITGATAASTHHVESGSLSQLLGNQYSVAAPSGAADFSGWNTRADGSGTAVQDGVDGDLAGLGTSTDGSPVAVTLFAQFAQPQSAPVLKFVDRHTVQLGHKLSFAVSASGTQPVTYKVTSGELPKGFTLNRTTGLISGTAKQAGVFTAFVTATNSVGSDWTPVTIVVPEPKDLLHTRNHVPAVEVGAAKVPLKVAGLKKGEHWTVRVDGKVVEHGTMKKAGTLAVTVHLGKALRDKVHTIVIAGSRKVTDTATQDSTTVTVTSLAARKTFSVKSLAGQDGKKYVVIERLAAGERVVVKDGGKVIASGHATEDGSFVFPQSKAGKGTSKLTVHGAAAKRSGKLTVKNPKH